MLANAIYIICQLNIKNELNRIVVVGHIARKLVTLSSEAYVVWDLTFPNHEVFSPSS